MKATNRVELNQDEIGFVESYNFSRGNLNEESRIDTVTRVASICVGNEDAKNKIKLYNRLATEAVGIPSSSYEFVPVLIAPHRVMEDIRVESSCLTSKHVYELNVIKYGEWVEDGRYLLTNLRALINDIGEASKDFYNTEDECEIIAKYFKVFKSKIDLSTRAQFVRHRASFQELSRRYVSNKKVPFEFYISPAIKEANMKIYGNLLNLTFANELAVNKYNELLEAGVKPQDARRILPQSMYTTVWSAWQPKQLENFLVLRTASGAQKEIRDLANGMKSISGGESNV